MVGTGEGVKMSQLRSTASWAPKSDTCAWLSILLAPLREATPLPLLL